MSTFEGVKFEIDNNCFVVTSGITGKPLHTKNLHEIRNRTELIIYVSSIMIRRWFSPKMHNMIDRHVELLLNRF